MKRYRKRLSYAVATLAILGSLGFGAAQAIGSGPLGNRCVNPESGCPCKAGCVYGGGKIGCCVPR